MVFMAMTGFAQQQPQTGDVIYVYQKDGDVQTFLREEIQEFYYGFEDEDGVTHDDLQMQWIVLEDSICKIPLANIDSVSFVTPPTVYQPGVIRIEEGLMDYVVSSDIEHLTFEIAANTPAALVPKVGDKIVTVVQNEKFPVGFAGKVSAVDGTTIRCEMPPIREIFDTYYSITSGGVYEESESRTRAFGDGEPKVFRYKPKKPIEIDKSTDLLDLIDEDEFTLSGKPSLKLSAKPDFEMKIVFMVNKIIDYKLSCELKGDIDMQSTVGIYGKAHIEKEFIEDGIPLFVIPILDVPLIVGHFRISPYIEMDGEVTTSYTGEELFDLDGTLFTIFEDEPKLGSFHVVPTFRSMSFEQNSPSSKSAHAFVGITANPSCLPSVQTGLRVTDSEGNIAGEWTSDEKMDANKKIGSMTHTFDNLANDKDYKLNPTIKVMGIEMLASPSEDLDRNDFPVRIVSFEQTGSHYSRQQGYEYDEKYYYYKFNATTTVSLKDEAQNVQDWGYIYHDFYGAYKMISCANLGGRTYADERYAYYFNEPYRTVELYPYVRYNGGDILMERL